MGKAIAASLLAAALALAPAAAVAQKFPDLAGTPPMGWNSWNHYGCEIDETLVRRTADALVASGMRDAGYVYVNIDDCWQGQRDADGFLQADPERFPSGIAALADYVHERGLKLGIYSDAGTRTCAGRPGSQAHEYQDALQFARWGVDYLKYDWCNTGSGVAQRNPREAYATMRDALHAAGRPIVFSICEWGDNRPWEWAGEIGHLWRTTGDIVNCWNCELGHGSWSSFGVLNILDKQAGLRRYAGPGGWNDPDMMEVGNLPTLAENRSHFALWAMLAAPLIAGTDVIGMKPEIAAILTNPRIVAIDQDPLGLQGFAWLRTPEIEAWARPLAEERWAIAVLNRSDSRRTHTIDFAQHPLSDDLNQKFARIGERHFRITEAWTGTASGTTRAPLTVTLAPRDTAVFVLAPE